MSNIRYSKAQCDQQMSGKSKRSLLPRAFPSFKMQGFRFLFQASCAATGSHSSKYFVITDTCPFSGKRGVRGKGTEGTTYSRIAGAQTRHRVVQSRRLNPRRTVGIDLTLELGSPKSTWYLNRVAKSWYRSAWKIKHCKNPHYSSPSVQRLEIACYIVSQHVMQLF